MGAYLRKPITEKKCESGEYVVGQKKLVYAATAMQGWRVDMEDAHAIVPDFDEDTSLFAVYDGHGGKEVAMYCAAKLGDVVKSTASYAKGDMSQALKEAFMKCDELVLKPETVQEMKKFANLESHTDSVEVQVDESGASDDEDPQEELSALIEEANVPLQSLLAKYGAATVDGDHQEDGENPPDVKSVLQMMADRAGFEIEFEEDSDSDADSSGASENEHANEGDDKAEDHHQSTEDAKSTTNGSVKSSEDCIQCETTDTKKADLEHEQNHSIKSTKFSLASLLTSSSSDITYFSTPVVSTSEMTSSAPLPSSSQPLDHQRHPSPPQDTLPLTNHTKVNKSTDASGSLCHVNKSIWSDAKQTPAKTSISMETNSEPETNSTCSPDDSNLKPLDKNEPPSSGSLPDACTSERTEDSKGMTTGESDTSAAAVTRTKTTGGLMDLLTTAVVNKDSALLMDSSEEDWMTPQPLKEVLNLSGSRKRPHPTDEMDDLTLSEFHAKRREIMDEEGFHSGTTAVVCVLKGDELTVANAGDSRCVVSSKGKALEMSFDHKPTDPPEIERIEKAGGQVGIDGRVNGGLNLTRAIGDHFYKGNTSLPLAEQMITAMPDIETLRITDDEEFIFLACDGIWNSKSSQDVVDFINFRISEKSSDGPPTGEDLVAICKSLCDACLAPDTDNDGTGCDNMTCLLIHLQSDQ